MRRETEFCDVCASETAISHIELNGRKLAVCSGTCFLIECERYYQDTVIAQKVSEHKKIRRIEGGKHHG